MYKLTLTASERKVIDWIGDRYSHGYDLFLAVWCCSEAVPDYLDWDSDVDISFIVPERTAWKIRDIGEECGYLWDCFSPKFAKKMTDFCMKIV